MYKNEASSSRHSTHVKMPKKKSPIASNEPNVSFKTFDAVKGPKTVWVPKNKA
jgi:hypothetical protein